jgi:hypothetical protein
MQGLPQQTCREFIAQNCKASVLRVFPGQLLDVRVDEVLEAAKAGKETAIRYPVSQVENCNARQETRGGIRCIQDHSNA